MKESTQNTVFKKVNVEVMVGWSRSSGHGWVVMAGVVMVGWPSLDGHGWAVMVRW